MRKERIRELADTIKVVEGFDAKQHLNPAGPTVSIYIPVKRTDREQRRDDWDRIEFKDLVKEAERTMAEQYPNYDAKAIFEKLDYILTHEDLPLWVDASAGLAFLANADEVLVYNLSYAPKATVVVGDAFYLKPLIRNTQYDMDYKLLLLNTDFFAVLDGNYNGVHYHPMPDDVKNYFAETFPEFDGETTALDYYSLEDHESPYHDHKSRNEVTQEETEKFFRYVNKAMNDTIVRDSETPVILVTLPEHEHMFREICTFKSLLPEGQDIQKDARTMTGTELRDAARKIMEGINDEQIAELKEKYGYHASKGTATDDVVRIGEALFDKRVGVLFLEDGKGIPGTFDMGTGTITYDGATNPVDDKELDPSSPDIANAFAIAAVEQDADIVVLPHEKMPTGNAFAVIDRY